MENPRMVMMRWIAVIMCCRSPTALVDPTRTPFVLHAAVSTGVGVFASEPDERMTASKQSIRPVLPL